MADGIPPESQKCVMIAAPHTSNWDIVMAAAAFYVMKVPLRFTIKKEWFRFPFNWIIGPLGGIPIDRSPKVPGEPRRSMVEAMVDLFEDKDELAVMVTPEGTRKKNDEWKTGFWYTAREAKVPICLGYLDYKHKIAGVRSEVIWPKNLEADMIEMMDFYKNIPPKFPENFSIDKRYS